VKFTMAGTNVLHDRRHAGERCNLDDAKVLVSIPPRSLPSQFRANHNLRFCEYCFPEDER
jgi:hypothetical protein